MLVRTRAGTPFGVGVGVPEAGVGVEEPMGNRFGGSCSCNVRTHVYVSAWPLHTTVPRIHARNTHAAHTYMVPGPGEDSPTRTYYTPEILV